MINLGSFFDLRWLTRRYYKKKGLIALDISHWPPYKTPSIRSLQMLEKSLFLKDAKENPVGIVFLKDWKRVVGVNQGYQVERLKELLNGLLKDENGEVNGLNFILVSRMGFSGSIKSFASIHKIELKSERDMTYEFPALGEFTRRLRRAMAEEMAKAEKKEKEKADVAALAEDKLQAIDSLG